MVCRSNNPLLGLIEMDKSQRMRRIRLGDSVTYNARGYVQFGRIVGAIGSMVHQPPRQLNAKRQTSEEREENEHREGCFALRMTFESDEHMEKFTNAKGRAFGCLGALRKLLNDKPCDTDKLKTKGVLIVMEGLSRYYPITCHGGKWTRGMQLNPDRYPCTSTKESAQ